MNPLPLIPRRLFARLALVLAAAASLVAPRVAAQVYVFNGITVVRPVPKTQPLYVNSGLVVSPALNAPTQIRVIVRRQGTITNNLLVLKPVAKKATYTYGIGTPFESTGTGTCTITSTGVGQGTGSTVTVALTAGNPKGAFLFRIQPGIVKVTASLKFTGGAAPYKSVLSAIANPPVIH